MFTPHTCHSNWGINSLKSGFEIFRYFKHLKRVKNKVLKWMKTLKSFYFQNKKFIKYHKCHHGYTFYLWREQEMFSALHLPNVYECYSLAFTKIFSFKFMVLIKKLLHKLDEISKNIFILLKQFIWATCLIFLEMICIIYGKKIISKCARKDC